LSDDFEVPPPEVPPEEHSDYEDEPSDYDDDWARREDS